MRPEELRQRACKTGRETCELLVLVRGTIVKGPCDITEPSVGMLRRCLGGGVLVGVLGGVAWQDTWQGELEQSWESHSPEVSQGSLPEP